MNTTTATTDEFTTVAADSVQIEDNIRNTTELDPAFLFSIATYGVLTPVYAVRNSDGIIRVRAGQRRTLAAQTLGVPLPVFIHNLADGEAEPDWTRTVLQIVENDHRNDLTQTQRAAAYRQLELDGLSVTKIASALAVPKVRVKAALTVAKSEKLTAAAAQYPIDLVQLAQLDEFADDTDAFSYLLEEALEDPDQLEHALSRARQQREVTQAVAAKRAELEAEGKTVYPVEDLHNQVVTRLAYLDKDDHAEVDPSLGDGVGYVVSWGWVSGERGVDVVEVVADLDKYGYTRRSGYGSGPVSTGPMTDEQKAERRRVVACNKAWDAAEPVRIAWLTNFLAGKSIPKDAASFIAIAETRYSYELKNASQNLAHQLLGIEHTYGGQHVNALAELVEKNPLKAGVVMLAVTLGGLESGTSRNTWRSPSAVSRYFLLQLRSWGYPVSPVELIALGEATDLPDTGHMIDDYDDDDSDVE
jgi:ParB family transcriptional regulator, chromosome partitioning protein